MQARKVGGEIFKAWKVNTFFLSVEHKGMVDMLSYNDAGRLIKALFEYAKSGEILTLSTKAQIVFLAIKQFMDTNNEKYKKRSEKARMSANSRWRASESVSERNYSKEEMNSLFNKIEDIKI